MPKKYEICLRLDEEEKERLERDAKRCRLTRNAYLRRLIAGTAVRERPNEEFQIKIESCGGQVQRTSSEAMQEHIQANVEAWVNPLPPRIRGEITEKILQYFFECGNIKIDSISDRM